MTTVVLGGAGTIGRSVVTELLGRDQAVRVVGRSADRLRQALGAHGEAVEIVSADLGSEEGRRKAVAGATHAVMAVGLPYTRREFARYPKLTADIARAAAGSGVTAFLQIATVYPFGRPQSNPVSESHPLQPNSVKGRYRLAQEQATLDADDPNGMRTVVLRLPDFLAGDTDRSFPGRIADAAVAGKTALAFGPVDKPHEYVFTPDVGPVVADLLNAPDRLGRAYNVAGSGVITQSDLADLIIAASGNRVRLRAVPPWVLKAVGSVVPAVREFSEMSYLLTDPVLLDESALVAAIGPVRHTPYEEAVKLVVEQARQRMGS
jgi:nucleoside-diphosphate-sugar epimerase